MPRKKSKFQRKVSKVMREFKQGKLKSERSKKRVSNRKQAIAIGLSEARKKTGMKSATRSGSRSGRGRGRSKSKGRSKRGGSGRGRK